MFHQLVTRLIPAIALLAWTATGPPAWAQHHGGGHHGGFGGGHHYGGGHYGGWGHYGYGGRHGYYSGYGYTYHHYSPLTVRHHYYGSHYYPYRHYYYGHHHYPYYGYSYWPWYYGYASPYGYGVYGSVPRVSYYVEPRAYAESYPRETTAGVEYLRRAETAFRAGDYEQAVRWANHAIIEMPRHGKHYLLLSQALFAVGEYCESAATLQQGMTLLNASDWGDVVKNFRRYYTGSDYVEQLKRLETFVEQNQDAAYARFLLGYHYGFLGYPTESRRELAKAVELEGRDEMAGRLLEHFGGQRTTRSTDEKRPKPAPVELIKPASQAEPANELVEYQPPRVPPRSK